MTYLRSNYPTTIDKLKTLPIYQDMTIEDKRMVGRYQVLVEKNNLTSDEQLELSSLVERLRDKMINSEDWNQLIGAVLNLETYFKDNVLDEIDNKLSGLDTIAANTVNTVEKAKNDAIANMDSVKTETINSLNRIGAETTSEIENTKDGAISEISIIKNEATQSITTSLNQANDVFTEMKRIEGNFKTDLPILNDCVERIEQADEQIKRLQDASNSVQDDIAKIESVGNKEILIRTSEWTLNGDVYEKEITHNLCSENLHVTAKNSDTKEAVTIGYKILDKTRILLKSDEAIPLSIILSASYYHATQTISDNIAEEVIKARKGEVDLKTKIDSIDEQLDKITYEQSKIKDRYIFIKLNENEENGAVECSEKIQNILNNAPIDSIVIGKPNATYLIKNSLIIPNGVNVDLLNAKLKATNGGTFISNYMMLINTTDCVSWTYAYPHGINRYVKNIFFINYENGRVLVDGLHAIKCHSNYIMENIYCDGIDRHIHISTEYLDYASAININCYRKQGTNYAVDTGFLGDLRKVEKLHLDPSTNLVNRKALITGSGHNSVIVNGVLNGDVNFGSCGSLKATNLHLEGYSELIVDGAYGKIENCFIWGRDLSQIWTIKNGSKIEFENVFIGYDTRETRINDTIDFHIDNNTNNRSVVTFKNCYRINRGDNIDIRYPSAITTNLDCSRTRGKVIGLNSTLMAGNVIEEITLDLSTLTGGILDSVTLDNNAKWLESGGSYYYLMNIIIDTVRNIGFSPSSGAKTIDTIINSSGVLLTTFQSPLTRAKTRIYRGTSANSYDKYVDVGIYDKRIIDNGNHVNGQLWKTRSASDKDILFKPSRITFNVDGTVTCYHNTTPNGGTWTIGDRIINIFDVSTGKTKGWIWNGTLWISEGTY